MSHKVKAWLSSIRRTHSLSSSFEANSVCDDEICPFDNMASDVIQYILSFLHHNELHYVRLIGKEWNNLCDIEQKILELNIETPSENLKYWMLKLRNIRHINLSHNKNIDNRFLIWLKKEYLPLKIKQKQRNSISSSIASSNSDICMEYEYVEYTEYNNYDNNIDLNIHIDLSFCFGIDCVEEPQLYGRGGVNGHNDYLKKLINLYTPYRCTFNIFGNFRIINPSITLHPKHVVLLQLYSLKYDEVQHCFKFASPANRQFTGPLPRFERMIKNGYPIMINWDNFYIGVYSINHHIFDKQDFIVTLSKKNKKEKFKWTLSRQQLEPYNQCWMTDSVCSLCSH